MKKAVMKEKSGKDSRVVEWWKKEGILAEGVAKMYGRKAAEKRRIGKIFKS